MPTLNAIYWENRYQQGETGWDTGSATTPISEYLHQLKNKNLRILIPGCGNAHEANYLINNGFNNITLLDIAETPVNEAKIKFKSAIDKKRLNII